MKVLKIRVEIDEVEIDDSYSEFDPPLRHIGHMTRYLSGWDQFSGRLSYPVGCEAQLAAVRIMDEAAPRKHPGSDAGPSAEVVHIEGDRGDNGHDDDEGSECPS